MFGLQKFEYDVIRCRGFCCSSSYSTCLASSEMVGYVGYVWKVQYFFKCFFYSYLSFFTLYSRYTYATSFEVGPHFLDVLLQFFAVIPSSFLKFFFGVSVWEVYWPSFNLTDSLFGRVQSTNKPVKSIIYLCYSVSDFSLFSLDSFLVFPSLYLHYSSVLADSLFLHLSP